MLKIWLNWLQPSLGVFGTALVIANPLYSSAAPRPVSVNNATKAAPLPTAWSSVKSSVGTTTIDRDLLVGIGATPDMAVRQLAIDSISASGAKSTVAVVANRKSLATLTAPAARSNSLSAKASKTKTVKNAITAALAPATKAQAKSNVLVPGLFIGTGDVRVADRFLPTIKPTARRNPLTKASAKPAARLGMVAASTSSDPYPVVRPELMQKLQSTSVAVSIPAIKATPRTLAPIASTTTRLPLVETTSSSDPIAGIPSGLQSLLGNSLNDRPTIATTPVAKAITNKSNSFVALKQLISPAVNTASVSISAGSLQLATAQAYTSAPKFSIPGETILGAKPVTRLLTLTPVQKKLAVSTIEGKNNYMTLMTDRQLSSATPQSWTVANQKSNLGGLILGSQPLATLSKSVTLGATTSLATANFQ
jgi:hypothetical protein